MKPLVIALLILAIPESSAAKIEWGSWTSCSVSCGNGTRSRVAICTTQGQSCNNVKDGINIGENQTEACNTHSCQNDTETTSTTTIAQSTQSNGQVTTIETTSNVSTTDQQTTTKATNTQWTPEQEGPSTQHQQTQSNTETPTEDVESNSFEVLLKLNRDYNEKLKDKTSKEFKELEAEINPKMMTTFENAGIKATVELLEATEGSIVLNFKVTTQNSASSSKIRRSLSSSIDSGPLSSLPFSSSVIVVAKEHSHLSDEDLNSATGDESEIVKPYLYFLYGFGGMIGLVIVFVVLAVTKKKVKPSPSVEQDDDYNSYLNTPIPTKRSDDDNFPKASKAW